MRQDADVKVLVIPITSIENATVAVAVEFGIGAGELVQMLGIDYSLHSTLAGTRNMLFCLSTNPTHLIDPPATEELLMPNLACYALSELSWLHVGTSYAQLVWTQHVELYGLIRPKRQVLLLHSSLGAGQKCRAEIYYSQVSATPEQVGAINRQYGKYRRT